MTIIERLRKEDAADLYLVLFTNVIGNHSHLFAAGDQSVLSTLEYENQPVLLPGVMSRKKDFLPRSGRSYGTYRRCPEQLTNRRIFFETRENRLLLEVFILVGNNSQFPVILLKGNLPDTLTDGAVHFLRDTVAGILLLGSFSSPAASSMGNESTVLRHAT